MNLMKLSTEQYGQVLFSRANRQRYRETYWQQ